MIKFKNIKRLKESFTPQLGEEALSKLIPDYKNKFNIDDMDLAMRGFIQTYEFDGELDDVYDELCHGIIDGTIDRELYYDLKAFIKSFCEVHRTLLSIYEKYSHANLESTRDGAERAALIFADRIIKHGL